MVQTRTNHRPDLVLSPESDHDQHQWMFVKDPMTHLNFTLSTLSNVSGRGDVKGERQQKVAGGSLPIGWPRLLLLVGDV